MIPANVREAMQRMNGDEWTGNDAVVVAQFAVPILKRIVENHERARYLLDYRRKHASPNEQFTAQIAEEVWLLETIMGDT